MYEAAKNDKTTNNQETVSPRGVNQMMKISQIRSPTAEGNYYKGRTSDLSSIVSHTISPRN